MIILTNKINPAWLDVSTVVVPKDIGLLSEVGGNGSAVTLNPLGMLSIGDNFFINDDSHLAGVWRVESFLLIKRPTNLSLGYGTNLFSGFQIDVGINTYITTVTGRIGIHNLKWEIN